MTSERNATIWIPVALCLAGVLMSLALAGYSTKIPNWALICGAITGVALVGSAVRLAFQNGSIRHHGGAGGRADALGEDSRAVGGRGGDAGTGDGGDGGTAKAKGRGSFAKGGDGGRG
jgi:hypothetical protein